MYNGMIGCVFSTCPQIREDVKTGVYVENLKEVEVKSVHDVVQLLIQVSFFAVIPCWAGAILIELLLRLCARSLKCLVCHFGFRELLTGKLRWQTWIERVVDHTAYSPAVLKARYVSVSDAVYALPAGFRCLNQCDELSFSSILMIAVYWFLQYFLF